MIGGQWIMSLDIDIDFDNLSEDELDEILVYSEDKDTFVIRYALACQVIANMVEDIEPGALSNIDMVDLTICKMLLDGYVEIENESKSIH